MDRIQAEKARQTILMEVLKSQGEDSSSDSDASPSPSKKMKTVVDDSFSDVHNVFWDCFNQVADENSNTNERASASDKSDAAKELDYFLKTARLDRTSRTSRWFHNSKHYPILAKFDKIYLSAPSSSVYSERLFSEAGNVYEDKRNRLLPVNAEKLTFIHHNLPLIYFKY